MLTALKTATDLTVISQINCMFREFLLILAFKLMKLIIFFIYDVFFSTKLTTDISLTYKKGSMFLKAKPVHRNDDYK